MSICLLSSLKKKKLNRAKYLNVSKHSNLKSTIWVLTCSDRSITVYHYIYCSITVYHNVYCSITAYHNVYCSITVYHNVNCRITVYHNVYRAGNPVGSLMADHFQCLFTLEWASVVVGSVLWHKDFDSSAPISTPRRKPVTQSSPLGENLAVVHELRIIGKDSTL